MHAAPTWPPARSPARPGGECCPGRRGEWWLRLSIDTEHLGRPEEALEVAEAALADEWLSHGDRLALQRRVLRLGAFGIVTVLQFRFVWLSAKGGRRAGGCSCYGSIELILS